MGGLAARMQSATDDATRASLGAELAAVRRRMTVASWVLSVLLVVAAGGMAVAHYLG
jgi:hypothetical protein